MTDNEEIHKDIEEIKKSVGSIKRYIFWSYFWNWAKIGFTVLVVILGYIYLPQFLENFRDWLIGLRKIIIPN